MLRTVHATTYRTALREGGSLPGLVEADDDGMYVVKFRGAGQGTAALVAEVVVGELGRALGIRVPELTFVDFDPEIARHEPDEEVQELLHSSPGLNLGMDFLPGSIGYTGVGWHPPPGEAVTIAWLDAFTANVDRTWRNPNLLVWHRSLWAIDHGAALVFQHAWGEVEPWSTRSYGLAEHALTPVLADVRSRAWIETGATLAAKVTPDLLGGLLDLVPDAWLATVPGAAAARRPQENDPASPPTPQQLRDRYVTYLLARRDAAETWWQGGPS